MLRRPSRLMRNLHTARPGLSYAIGAAVWLLTTVTLLYFVKIFVLAEGQLPRLGVALFGVGVLAVHSAMSVYLSDGCKVRFRKLNRENHFIRFLRRFG